MGQQDGDGFGVVEYSGSGDGSRGADGFGGGWEAMGELCDGDGGRYRGAREYWSMHAADLMDGDGVGY